MINCSQIFVKVIIDFVNLESDKNLIVRYVFEFLFVGYFFDVLIGWKR